MGRLPFQSTNYSINNLNKLCLILHFLPNDVKWKEMNFLISDSHL